ncbi:MAG TPA: NADPH:quinone reductase [Gemmataceae bacterium]|jgi:NADPH2:quinone reductase|nr:NADPH:quinone reductase [Gemmataceae bacterium]
MKAAFLEKTGGPEVIQYGDLPTPTPGNGEVRVRVAAVAVNPIDTYVRAGIVSMSLPKPFIPGCDLAGVVDLAGPGVTRFEVGDRVWGSNQGLLGRQGTFAEYACVREEFLYPTPPGIADTDAAAVALTGITAHLGLCRCAKLLPGETVFVQGGTGGVGSMVVQMAKAVGARAIATVGSAENAKVCKSLGADLVLNYKSDDVPVAVKAFTNGQGVNVWFETQSEHDFVRTVDLTAKRGRIIVMAGRQARPVFPVGPFYTRDISLFGFAMFNATPDEQHVCAADMDRWLQEKKLKPVIGRTFHLSEAAAAHRLQEENTVHKHGSLSGKIVLTP